MYTLLLKVRNFMEKHGILVNPHGLFSIYYCRKLNRDKLIDRPFQMVFCGRRLKTSPSGLHSCGQFLHLYYTYLRLA